MSNLGGYQTIVTVAKKLGGPVQYNLAVFGAGVITASTIYIVAQKITRKMNDNKAAKTKQNDSLKEYVINENCVDGQGLVFKIGDRYRVLEEDGDAVLIELMGSNDNPYFVSKDLLKEISDYS